MQHIFSSKCYAMNKSIMIYRYFYTFDTQCVHWDEAGGNTHKYHHKYKNINRSPYRNPGCKRLLKIIC